MILSMQKRSSRHVNRIAARIARDTAGIELTGKNPAAVALGRLGGLRGGRVRAERLTAEQRQEIARKAAEARWTKKKKQE